MYETIVPSLRIPISADEQDRLDAEALAWSRSHRRYDCRSSRLCRYAGIISYCKRRDPDGYPSRVREVIVHLEALDTTAVRAALRALLPIIEPGLPADEIADAEIYNIYHEEENPGFVLRGVVASSNRDETIDQDAVWLFAAGPWPGLRLTPCEQIPDACTP